MDSLSSDQLISATDYNTQKGKIAENMSTVPPPPPRPGQVQVPPLREFIGNLVKRSRLQTGTFLSTLVYLDRLRLKLGSLAQGLCQSLKSAILSAQNLQFSF
jgi:G1/S-specific cyclin PLC1